MTRTDPTPPRRRAGLAIGYGLLLLLAAGCGKPGDGFSRFPVEGTVTLDGKPLKSGTITFNATGQGASSSGEIAEGAFKLSGDDGLSPGPYRVEIYSIQPTGKKVPSAEDPGTLVDETTNVVPKQYNASSTLTTEIPAGGPKEPVAFPLVSTPAPGKRR